jgi:hypothetical protein
MSNCHKSVIFVNYAQPMGMKVSSVLFFPLQKVVYQCTYPGCKIAAVKSIRAIEAHVRREHLGRADDHPGT